MIWILSQHIHRVAISNRRLVALDADGVAFRYKDYRRNGQERYRTMTPRARRVHPALPAPRPAQGLPPHPPLRALASAARKGNIARVREVPSAPEPPTAPDATTKAAAAAPNDHRPPM
jgi:hypothetical protein